MPPFGFDDDRLRTLQSTFSYWTEEVDGLLYDGNENYSFKTLFLRLESDTIPMGLTCALQSLFHRATEFNAKVRRESRHHMAMIKAVDSSIRSVLSDVVDQIVPLLDMEDDQRRILATIAGSSIHQAFKYFDTLESMVLDVDNEKLEHFWRELSEVDDTLPIRVSMLSRALAFEFMAGKTESTTNVSGTSQNSHGLKVTVAPFLIVKSDDIAEKSSHIYKDAKYRVKIDYFSHKELFHSSGSGVLGEAIVRIYVGSGNEGKVPKEGGVWMKSGDCRKLNLLEVRAVQRNAYPRHVQTRLDLYVASMYGMSGLIVTMKMKTYKSFNGELPDLDIQLIIEPPSL